MKIISSGQRGTSFVAVGAMPDGGSVEVVIKNTDTDNMPVVVRADDPGVALRSELPADQEVGDIQRGLLGGERLACHDIDGNWLDSADDLTEAARAYANAFAVDCRPSSVLRRRNAEPSWTAPR